MKINRIAALIAAVALSACGAKGEPASAPAAQPSAPQPSTPQQMPPGKPEATPEAQLSPAFLVGRWGDNGDCTKDIILNADRTFHSYTGGNGVWSLYGDQLVMSGAYGSSSVQLTYVDQNRVMIHNGDGSVGFSQRC